MNTDNLNTSPAQALEDSTKQTLEQMFNTAYNMGIDNCIELARLYSADTGFLQPLIEKFQSLKK